jgi:hypothetical protein
MRARFKSWLLLLEVLHFVSTFLNLLFFFSCLVLSSIKTGVIISTFQSHKEKKAHAEGSDTQEMLVFFFNRKLFLSLWPKYLTEQLKEEEFTLAHDFRGFGPWLRSRTSWQWETLHLMADWKQRMRKQLKTRHNPQRQAPSDLFPPASPPPEVSRAFQNSTTSWGPSVQHTSLWDISYSHHNKTPTQNREAGLIAFSPILPFPSSVWSLISFYFSTCANISAQIWLGTF